MERPAPRQQVRRLSGRHLAARYRRAYEKRGVATFVPEWNPENCIQCNRCSYVCPHASIRPFVLTSEEAAKAPFGEEHSIPAIGKEFVSGSRFVQQVDVLDCLGCGNCVDVSPGQERQQSSRDALSLQTQEAQDKNWEWLVRNVTNKADKVNVALNVKNSQFAQPLFEFSGACSGCGETPLHQAYHPALRRPRDRGQRHRLLLDLFRFGAQHSPTRSMRRVTVLHGQTPLFEDFCEYGLGMYIGYEKLRDRVRKPPPAFPLQDRLRLRRAKSLSAGSTDAMTVPSPA